MKNFEGVFMYKMHKTKRVIQTKYVLSETEYALVLKDRETIKQLTGVEPGKIIVLKDYLEDLERSVSFKPCLDRLLAYYEMLINTPEASKHEGIKEDIFDCLNDLYLQENSQGKYKVVK